VGAFGLSWTVRKKGSAYSLAKLFNPLTLKEYTRHHNGEWFPILENLALCIVVLEFPFLSF
jgi:hypothetical protein